MRKSTSNHEITVTILIVNRKNIQFKSHKKEWHATELRYKHYQTWLLFICTSGTLKQENLVFLCIIVARLTSLFLNTITCLFSRNTLQDLFPKSIREVKVRHTYVPVEKRIFHVRHVLHPESPIHGCIQFSFIHCIHIHFHFCTLIPRNASYILNKWRAGQYYAIITLKNTFFVI